MSYLKALGVLRLVSEQADPGARGCWRDGAFVLISCFDMQGLQTFLEHAYRPTPILVPWSGGDFFGVSEARPPRIHKNPPTSSQILEAFLATTTERLQEYRDLIRAVLLTMREIGVATKKDIEGTKGKSLKRRLLGALRSRLPDRMSEWLDTAVAIEPNQASFNILLGSGGGSDGNAHFSDNFMQNLWDCLPDFDAQRAGKRNQALLNNAISGQPVSGLADRTSALFDSGATGGPNSSCGFEDGALINPWNFILGLEGTLLFAGAVTKKLDDAAASAFPFTVSASAAGYGTAVRKEEGQREIWLPLWRRPAVLSELRAIFAEGRAQVGAQASRSGSDFARAVTSYGVDRGFEAFMRYAIVKGRVGGENYHTAVPLGRFEVCERQQTDLLLDVGRWLDQFRRAAYAENAAARFAESARRIDAAILDFCRLGGASRMAVILRALGQAERNLANDPKHPVLPAGPLAIEWVEACDDGSVEYRLAASLASICGDSQGRVADLRADLEPVAWENGRWRWASRDVTWGASPLARNLTAVLVRRLMESRRAALVYPALWGKLPASERDVAMFLWRQTDDELIGQYLWGLALVDRGRAWPELRPQDHLQLPLPRLYALLKLVFLAAPLRVPDLPEPVSITCEPEVLGRLRAGHRTAAARLAVRRLRASGLPPKTAWDHPQIDPAIEVQRLAAALLFPIRAAGLARKVLQKAQAKEIV
jgi:CRISPR-associated protein Csx17